MSEHARCNKVTVVIAAGALTWCAASLTHCAQKNEEQKAAPAKGNASSLEKGEARPSAKVPRKSSPSFTPPDRELLIVRLEHGRPRNLLRVHSHDPRTGATTRVFDSSRTKKLGVDRYTAVCRGGDVFVTGYAAKANRGSDADADESSKDRQRWLYRIKTDGSHEAKAVLRLKEPHLRFSMDPAGERIAYWAKRHLWVQELGGKVSAHRKIRNARYVHVLQFLPGHEHLRVRIEEAPKGHRVEGDPAGLYRVALTGDPEANPIEKIYSRHKAAYYVNTSGDRLHVDPVTGGPTYLTVRNSDGKTTHGPRLTPTDVAYRYDQLGHLALDPSGRWVAYMAKQGDVWVADMVTGRHRRVETGVEGLSCVCWGRPLPPRTDATDYVESDRAESVPLGPQNTHPADWKEPGGLPDEEVALAPAGSVHSVVFSPRRSELVTVGRERRVRFWRLSHDHPVRPRKQHSPPCSGRAKRLAFAGRGRWLLYLMRDRVCVAEKSSAKQKTFSGAEVKYLAATPNGRLAVTGHGRTLMFVDLAEGRWSSTPFKTCSQRGVAITPAGDHVAVACAGGGLDIYRIELAAKAPPVLLGEGSAAPSLEKKAGAVTKTKPRNKAREKPRGQRREKPRSEPGKKPRSEPGKKPRREPGKKPRNEPGKKAPEASPRSVPAATAAISAVEGLEIRRIHHLKDVGAHASRPVFSRDGQLLAVIEGPTATLWETKSGRKLGTLKGHPMWLTALAITPDGRHVVTAGLEGTIRVWDAKTQKTLHRLQARLGRVAELTFSGDGKWLGAGSADDGTVALFDTRSWQPKHRLLADHPSLESLGLDPGRRILAAVSSDDRLRIWTIPQGRLLATLPKREVVAVTLAGEGRLLTVFARRSTFHWDLRTGTRFAADTKAASNTKNPLSEPAKKERTRFCSLYQKRSKGGEYPLVTRSVFDVAEDLTARSLLHPDPRQIANLESYYRPAACPGKGRFSHVNRLRDSGIPSRGVLSPAGDLLAGLTSRKHVGVWTVKGYEKRFATTERPISTFAFSPSGDLIAAGTKAYGRIVTHDVQTGKRIARFTAYQPRAMAFTPDGKHLLVGGRFDGRLTIFDPRKGKRTARRRPHTSRIVAIRFSKDRKLLVTAGRDGRIQLRPWRP